MTTLPNKRAVVVAVVCILLFAWGFRICCFATDPLDEDSFTGLYAEPPSSLQMPLNVYHIGHSLVGHDMPVMLQQLAGNGYSFSSQLGWGSFLREHWEPDVAVKGFAESNRHPQYREPREAIASGEYDVLVLTEAVEIRDAIRYFKPHKYLAKWASAARSKNPNTRIFFYETWHRLDDPAGWMARVEHDLPRYWEDEILRRALAIDDRQEAIYMIPGGQVMARLIQKIESHSPVGPVKTRHDLFTDQIHLNDLGAYLMALTHYAVIFQRSPVGLPHRLWKADGSAATDPGVELALLMQETVWDVVTSYDKTGVPQRH